MDVFDYFESKLPIISVVHDGQNERHETMINIKSSPTEEYSDSIVIENIGADTLKGNIYTDSTVVVFDVMYFTGNRIEMRYRLNIAMNSQKKIFTEVTIVSNGGEHVLKFEIDVMPPTLFVANYPVNDIASFYNLWEQSPTVAKNTFSKHDFYLWLYACNYKHLDIYEQFRSDTNKERGLSNFFIFNKLKTPVELYLVSEKTEILLDPLKTKKYTEKITIYREGAGFTYDTIECNVPWITLAKTSITTADFKQDNKIEVFYEIDKKLITKKIQYAIISLKLGTGQVHVKAKVPNVIDANLIKNYAGINDKMFLHIKNNVDEPLKIEIVPSDSFIEFEAAIHTIDKEETLPFSIKLSTLQLAQKNIRKRPVFQSSIRIKSSYQDKKFFQDIELIVGDFN